MLHRQHCQSLRIPGQNSGGEIGWHIVRWTFSTTCCCQCVPIARRIREKEPAKCSVASTINSNKLSARATTTTVFQSHPSSINLPADHASVFPELREIQKGVSARVSQRRTRVLHPYSGSGSVGSTASRTTRLQERNVRHRTASATACMNRQPSWIKWFDGSTATTACGSRWSTCARGEGCQGPGPADLAGAGRVRVTRVSGTPPHNAGDARSRRRPLESVVSASPFDARHVQAWSAVSRMHRTASASRSPSILGRIP